MDLGNACSGLGSDTLDELRAIVALHETAAGLIMKLVGRVGSGAESLMAKMLGDWQARIGEASEIALRQAYDIAFATQGEADAATLLGRALAWADGELWHKVATGVTGALGGLGGIATTLVDLPVTTTLILRSIQQIAAGHGEDLTAPDVRAQCLAVLGMGGPLAEDDDTEAGLWATRTALSGKAVAEMLRAVLPRFGVVVGEKALAQATPLLGAVAGGAINPVFTGFYQTMAHVHFRLRKLERDHDREQLRACFERLARADREEKEAALPSPARPR